MENKVQRNEWKATDHFTVAISRNYHIIIEDNDNDVNLVGIRPHMAKALIAALEEAIKAVEVAV